MINRFDRSFDMSVLAESGPFVFRTPANFQVIGQSQSGKSHLVLELLNRPDLFDQPIDNILFFYGIETDHLPSGPRFHLIKGLPDPEMLKTLCARDRQHRVVVIDDLLTETLANKDLLIQLFTRISHHMNISIFLLSQSLFDVPRIIRNNSHYMILFKALLDKLNISNLARQLFPGQSSYFMQSFADACDRNWGYLCVSAHPKEVQQHFRLCTDLLGVPKCYLPKH